MAYLGSDDFSLNSLRYTLLVGIAICVPPFIVFPLTGKPIGPAYYIVLAYLLMNLGGLWLLRRENPPKCLIAFGVGLGTVLLLFFPNYFGLLGASGQVFVIAAIAPVLVAMVVDDRRAIILLCGVYALCTLLIFNGPLPATVVEQANLERSKFGLQLIQVVLILSFVSYKLNRRLHRSKLALLDANQQLEVSQRDLSERVRERTIHLERSREDLQRALDERSRAFDALQASQEQLVQSQRTESLGYLAGGVVHDFNNLLTVILGSADLMQAKARDEDGLDEDIKAIKDASLLASQLTGRLLAYSRQQVMEPTLLSANQVCEEAAELLVRLMGKHIGVDVELSAAEDTVLADRPRLDQVLLNLGVNARDAMPDGGTLWLRTRLDGGFVVIEVQDQGCGIPSANLARIFDPLFTTKEKGKGTGLGLATVAGIIEQSNGMLEVDSRLSGPNRGSTFRVRLPLITEAVIEDSRVNQMAGNLGRRVVLVVDNDLAVLQGIKQTLEGMGFEVLTADRPSSAMSFVNHDGPIDCLVTDLVMPECDGLSFAREFLGDRPVPTLLLTGESPDPAVQEILVNEEVNLLRKPFQPGDLIARVLETLEKEGAPGWADSSGN